VEYLELSSSPTTVVKEKATAVVIWSMHARVHAQVDARSGRATSMWVNNELGIFFAFCAGPIVSGQRMNHEAVVLSGRQARRRKAGNCASHGMKPEEPS